MKKLLVSLVATALMALGLIGAASTPAHAACPYSGCIATEIHLKSGPSHISKGDAPTFTFKVTAPGSGVPNGGQVIVKCRRDGFRAKVGTGHINDNGVATINMPKFKKAGTWHCTASYLRHYPYKRSSTSFTLTVG